jgi:hypothetical protein
MIKHVIGPDLEFFQSTKVHAPVFVIQGVAFKHKTDAKTVAV